MEPTPDSGGGVVGQEEAVEVVPPPQQRDVASPTGEVARPAHAGLNHVRARSSTRKGSLGLWSAPPSELEEGSVVPAKRPSLTPTSRGGKPLTPQMMASPRRSSITNVMGAMFGTGGEGDSLLSKLGLRGLMTSESRENSVVGMDGGVRSTTVSMGRPALYEKRSSAVASPSSQHYQSGFHSGLSGFSSKVTWRGLRQAPSLARISVAPSFSHSDSEQSQGKLRSQEPHVTAAGEEDQAVCVTAPSFSHPAFHLVDGYRFERTDKAVRLLSTVREDALVAIHRYVCDCLKHFYGMLEVPVPSLKAQARSVVFATSNWATANKVLVLVNDQVGCPLGLWSRALCMEEGLRFGSMLPYVDTAFKQEYAVIIANPNENYVVVRDDAGNKQKAPVEGSSTPQEHMAWVYDNLLLPAKAEYVFLVGYGAGGPLCKEVVKRSYTTSLQRRNIMTIVTVEGLAMRDPEDSSHMSDFLSTHCTNLQRSLLAKGVSLLDHASALGVGSCLSLGSGGPEEQLSWSMYPAMKDVFKVLQRSTEKRMQWRMPRGLASLLGGAGSKRVLPTADGLDSTCDDGPGDPASYPVTPDLRWQDSWVALLNKHECLSLNDFTLERVIGKGAFGKVLLVSVGAEPKKRIYAIKVISKYDISRRGYIGSTKLERDILCEAHHPFIVQLRFSFQSGAKLYLGTDFYPGGNLLVHLKRVTAFSEEAARFFAVEILAALSWLHSKNIVYRDLKPENVLMEPSGHVALTDFGLAKRLLPGQRTATFCGTAEYLAPEQLRRLHYDTTTDWWALGIFIYELLLGRSPFYNKSRSAMYERIVTEDPSFPSDLGRESVDLLTGLLQKDPEKRLGSTASEAIRTHPFFSMLDWERVMSKGLSPPVDPGVSSPGDCKYISSRYLSVEPRDSLGAETCQRFTGFSFLDDEVSACVPTLIDGSRESTSSDVSQWFVDLEQDFVYEMRPVRGKEQHGQGRRVSIRLTS